METNQQQMDTSLTLWSLQSSGAQRQTSSTYFGKGFLFLELYLCECVQSS